MKIARIHTLTISIPHRSRVRRVGLQAGTFHWAGAMESSLFIQNSEIGHVWTSSDTLWACMAKRRIVNRRRGGKRSHESRSLDGRSTSFNGLCSGRLSMLQIYLGLCHGKSKAARISIETCESRHDLTVGCVKNRMKTSFHQ